MLMEIAHAHRSTRLGSYAPLRSLRCGAYGAERYSFFNGKAVYQTGKKSSGARKLDTSGFCTSWKGAEINRYLVVLIMPNSDADEPEDGTLRILAIADHV